VFGQYVLHYPITDFAVSLVVLAAFIDLLGRGLERPQWQIAVDWLLFTGFAAGLAAMGTGLWLVTDHHPANEDTMWLHRSFAYSTVCATGIAVAARSFERRVPRLGALRTLALAIAAGLVCCTGYIGGRMTHAGGGNHVHTHDGTEPQEPALEQESRHEAPAPVPAVGGK
jgi:uncharacterized membrane protein